MLIHIYTLIDPRTNAIRYVGQTRQELKSRLDAHCRMKTNRHVISWITQLQAEGLQPLIVSVDTAETVEEADDKEILWIAQLKAQGCKLTNLHEGGQGKRIISEETRERLRSSHIGKKQSEETKQKRNEKLRGRVSTTEERERLLQYRHLGPQAVKGKKFSDEKKMLYRQAQFNKTKLTLEDIYTIRASTDSLTTLAVRYGYTVAGISQIRRRKTYGWIPDREEDIHNGQ